MAAFLDFEASSLSKRSYPIEVGWVRADGTGEGHLIRPAEGWDEWDAAAEAVHGISRQRLLAEGEPHGEVCARLVALFAEDAVFCSAPSWDGHWLSMLLRASGRPRHLLRMADSDVAFAEAARQRLGQGADEAERAALVKAARDAVGTVPAAHRALADARREWLVWKRIAGG